MIATAAYGIVVAACFAYATHAAARKKWGWVTLLLVLAALNATVMISELTK